MRCSWLGAVPLKCEHVAEMWTCLLQAACSTGDSTNDCKRLLEAAFGWSLPFFWGSLGSALSSCNAGWLTWILVVKTLHGEDSPPAISSPSSSQRPVGKAAAPSCWPCWCSPVLALQMVAKSRHQPSLLMWWKPRKLLHYTHMSTFDPSPHWSSSFPQPEGSFITFP